MQEIERPADPILLPYSQRVHCAYERVERLQCELCVKFRLNCEIVALAFIVFEFPLPSERRLLTLVLHRRLKEEWSEGILLEEARQLLDQGFRREK